MTRTDFTAPQQALHRGTRVKCPQIVDAVDCLHVAAPVDARLALAIAHDTKDWFSSMSRCIVATVAPDAKGTCHPAFTSALLCRLFSEIVAERTGMGCVR